MPPGCPASSAPRRICRTGTSDQGGSSRSGLTIKPSERDPPHGSLPDAMGFWKVLGWPRRPPIATANGVWSDAKIAEGLRLWRPITLPVHESKKLDLKGAAAVSNQVLTRMRPLCERRPDETGWDDIELRLQIGYPSRSLPYQASAKYHKISR
jgi:hypothetical protein